MANEVTGIPTSGSASVDYLGRESPLGFEGTPALPVGGSGVGATAGPSTTSGGFVPRSGGEGPDEMARVMDELRRLGLVPEPGGTGGGAGGVGPGAEGTISGFSPGLVSAALSSLGLAAGIPGVVGLATGLASGIPAATGVPGVPSIGLANQGLTGLLDMLGLLPEQSLSLNTPQGPVAVGVNNEPTGLLGLLGALLGITPAPTFSVANPDANLGELTSAQISEINTTPEIAMQSAVSPTIGIASTSPSFGWVDTSGIAMSSPIGDAPPGGVAPSAPTGPGDDPSGDAPGGGGTGPGGGNAGAAPSGGEPGQAE